MITKQNIGEIKQKQIVLEYSINSKKQMTPA